MSNTTKQAAYKARKKAQGLAEVRGIWARPEDHALIKSLALNIDQEREKYIDETLDAEYQQQEAGYWLDSKPVQDGRGPSHQADSPP